MRFYEGNAKRRERERETKGEQESKSTAFSFTPTSNELRIGRESGKKRQLMANAVGG